MNELCKGDGKHENGGSEDDRNDPGLIHLERQVGGVSAIHSASNDTLCILDRNSALSFIDFDDHQDHDESNDKEQKQLERRNGTDLQVIDHRGDSLREAGYDTTEDDEGNTITDPVFRNFFADPHEEAGASGEDDDNEYKIQPAVIDKSIVDAQGIGHAECLYSCEEDRKVSGDLLDLLEAFLSVLSPFFECRNDGCHTQVLVGYSASGDMKLPTSLICDKEITIKSVFRYRHIYPLAIQAVAEGKVNLKGIVTNIFELDDIQNAMDRSVNEKADIVKSVVKIS